MAFRPLSFDFHPQHHDDRLARRPARLRRPNSRQRLDGPGHLPAVERPGRSRKCLAETAVTSETTGASRSVVDARVAAELGLPTAGDEVEVAGVGGRATARPVRVSNWRVGEIDIPASTLDALELSGGDGETSLQGLLGSDTLSRFQVIHIDYKNERLIFHPGPSGRLPHTD